MTIYELTHRAVAKVFIGEPPTKRHQVNHKNGVKTDNRVANLEWVTQRENMAHSREVGIMPLGADRPNAKLTQEKVLQMRLIRRETGRSYRSIASEFGVSQMVAWHAVRGKRNWSHVA